MAKYIMALDQGTTSSRCILFDKAGNICSMAQREFEQIYPKPGWVEHNPMEIWSTQYAVMSEAMALVGAKPKDIAGIGITNQRETTIVWDKETGEPVYNAIVWQCRRTAKDINLLVKDVKTGLEHYEDFVNTGMKWFVDEEKLFKKNKELIDKAIERLESNSSATESYYRTLKEIHYLEDQLKIAMNKHAELLRDCTDMQNKTDEAVKKAKLSRLRPHMDFTATLSDMIRTDDASLLAFMIEPLLKLNIKKTFDIKTIDEALLVKPARYDKKEYVTEDTPEDIVYEDEIEDERIRHNYIFIMNNLKECINRKCLNKSDILTLGEFNNIMSEAYGEAVLNNADYYSFFVNLCQKDSYVIGGDNMQSETFLDDILKEGFEGSEPLHIVIEKGTEEIIDYTNVQVTNITFRKEADDGK